jgi:uncharacterized coiled-coil DUF342 family protein
MDVNNKYDSELCKNKHENIEEKIDNIHIKLNDHEEIIKEHSREITNLKEDNREFKTEIKNLIKKMDDFMVTLRWGLGIFVTVCIFVIGILIKK